MKRMAVVSCALALLGVGAVVSLSQAAPGSWGSTSPSFVGLGDLPGDAEISYAYAISDSGHTIVGESFSAISQVHGEGARWTRGPADTWQLAGLGLPDPLALNTPASGISGNGFWVVGRASFPFPTFPVDTYAYRWNPWTGFQLLAVPSGYLVCAALHADRYGLLVVGWGGPNPSYNEARALAWPQLGPPGQVETIEPTYESQAVRTDPQGLVVIGWGESPAAGAAGREAVYWRRGFGGSWVRHWLGALPGVDFRSQAAGITRLGLKHVIVGYSGDFSSVTLPTLWRVRGPVILEMAELPLLPGCTSGAAYAISDDGSRVVGNCWDANFEFRACVWESASPSSPYVASDLQERLGSLGVTTAVDWILFASSGISRDGRTICGYGLSPLGVEEGWVAELP